MIHRWGHQVPPYRGGPFVSQYAAGVALLDDMFDEHRLFKARAARARALDRTLALLTPLLAATAGITTLPADLSDWLTAAAAFGAAAISGLAAAFDPAAMAIRSEDDGLALSTRRRDVERFLRWLNEAEASADVATVEQRLAELQARHDAILARRPASEPPDEEAAGPPA